MKTGLFLFRIVSALLFIFAGTTKLLTPEQNFLFVLDSYQMPLGFMTGIIVLGFPWIELICAVYLLVGLWLPLVLRLFALFSLIFAGFNLQAIIRGLPLRECGCFGDLLPLSLQTTLALDIFLFAGFIFSLKYLSEVSFLSFDKLFKQTQTN